MSQSNQPQFVYLHDDLLIEAEFPGTRFTPPFAFKFRPADFGDAMDAGENRQKLLREESGQLNVMRRKLAANPDSVELASEIADEERRVNDRVAMLQDFHLIARSVKSHTMVKQVGETTVPVNLADLADYRRLPPGAIKYMLGMILATAETPSLPDAALGMVANALGKSGK